MAMYRVVFAYSIHVEAEDEDSAESLGADLFVEDAPSIRDMGCIVEELEPSEFL